MSFGKRKAFLLKKNNKIRKEGFDFRKEGEIFKRSISPKFYSSTVFETFFNKLSNMIVLQLNYVESIRKQFMYSVDKEYDELD
jgi:hypothetical protein